MKKIDQERFHRILNGWHHFAMMESISSTKINLDSLKENNSFENLGLSLNNNLIELSNTQNDFIYKNYIKREIKDTEEVLLFFPIITKFVDGKKVGLPLFALKLTPELNDIYTTKKINFETDSVNENLHVMKEVFENTLNMPEEELPTEMSIIDFMDELSGNESSSFNESYNSFISFLHNLNLKVLPSAVISKGDTTYEFKTFSSQIKLIKDIGIDFSPLAKEYLSTTHDEQIEIKSKFWYGGFSQKHPLSKGQAKVLLAKQTEKLIPVKGAPGTGKTTLLTNIISEHFTSKILDSAINDIQSSSLMLVLSSANKAVENIEDAFLTDPFFKDRKDFYLFLGNTKKMQDAVTRINSFLKHISKAKIDEEEKESVSLRINEILNEINSDLREAENIVDFSAKEEELNIFYEEISKKIESIDFKIRNMDIEPKIASSNIHFLEEMLKHKTENVNIENKIRFLNIKMTNKMTELSNIQSEIESLEEKILDEKIMQNYIDYSIEELNKEITLIKKRDSLKKEFDGTPLLKRNIDKSSFVAKELNKLIDNINSIPFFFLESIFKKREKLINKFWNRNSDFLTSIGFRRNMVTVEKLNDLYDYFLDISNFLDKDIYNILYQEDDMDIISILLELIRIKRDISLKNGKLKILNNEIDNIKNERRIEEDKLKENNVSISLDDLQELLKLKNELIELEQTSNKIDEELNELQAVTTRKGYLFNGNVEEICRVRHYKLQRELFELCVKYNEYIQIENKVEIIRALTSFEKMITNTSTADIRSEWAGREDELYLYLSMVFPLLTSTIASFNKIIKTFSDGFFSNDGRWVKWNKFKEPPFSLLLSDESGMTKVHSLFTPIFYSKKAVVVGDEDQLEPIISLSEKTIEENIMLFFQEDSDEGAMYSPGYIPAFSRAAGQLGVMDKKGRSIILDEHRRCQPKIAAIFKEIIKDNYSEVEIKTEPLIGKRLEKLNNMGGKNLIKKNVVGSVDYQNVNKEEINEVESMLNKLENAGYDLTKDVGIITPYRGQAKELIKRFENRLQHSYRDKKIGTVHSFQGSEFEVVILSTVVTGNKSIRFINAKRNLLNVSVSRAKDLLIVIGDINKLKEASGPSEIMIEHIEKEEEERG